MAERLFVGSLPLYAESHEVADLFRPYGEVRKASVIFDGNGRSRGFGFVLFSSSSDTLSVLEHHGRVGFTMGLMRDGTPHKLEVRREKKRSEAQRPEGAPMGDGSGGKKKRKNRPCGKKRRAAFLEQQAAATSAAAAAAASPLKAKKTSMRKSKNDAEKAPKSPKEDATKSTEPKSGKASKLRGVTSGRIAKPNNKAAAA
jgi:RNA recognition motif-containing protein